MAPEIVPASDSAIERAAQLLRAGELVAFPTETVYGLGGDATSETAVARIFVAKGRPRFNPLILHVPGVAETPGQRAVAAGQRRARHGRVARAGPSGRAAIAARRRETDRRAIGQP